MDCRLVTALFGGPRKRRLSHVFKWMTDLRFSLVCLLVLCNFLGVRGREATVTGLVGHSAELPCEVDEESCGKVYFITWTKNVSSEWKRLYLFSETVEKPLQELANPDRADFYKKGSLGYLRISPLRLEDEGSYKCDVTYIQGKCPSLSYANLVTYNTPGLPVLQKEGIIQSNASIVGPLYEGMSLSFDCNSIGGKPVPEISWWKGDDELPSKSDFTRDRKGISNVSSSLSFELARSDVGKKLECRVESEATRDAPLITFINLDVHVAPWAIDVNGPGKPSIAGHPVILTCDIAGAKPAADATWYNGSDVLHHQPRTKAEAMADGTYTTTSVLEIVVTRHDHQRNFYCKGSNPVVQRTSSPALLKSVTLEVLYPPAVTIQPSGGIIVNESSNISFTCTYDANPENISSAIWLKDDKEIDLEEERFLVLDNSDDSSDPPKLVIQNVTRSDQGYYSCSLDNPIGPGEPLNKLELNVLYPPTVQAQVSPSVVSEGQFTRVSLICDILEANPQNLIRVRWYKDDELMNETTEKEIVWMNVSRSFTGQYYCEGENAAGWGEMSDPVDLVVQFAPSKATLILMEETAVKGMPVNMKCIVDDLGFPEANVFRWEHEDETLEPTTDNFTISAVELQSRGNYSCSAVNIVGSGPEGFLYLTPKAPPSFVDDLPKVFGAASDSDDISVSCRVECDPMCDIEWLKDDESLVDSDLYFIKSNVHPEDEEENVFQSVVSTLYWNMTAWPTGELSRVNDDANYTCRSSDNLYGPGVSFTMLFNVEYGPENVSVSTSHIDIIEGEVPEKIFCFASSFPPSEFYWKYFNDVIAGHSTLFLNYSLPREKAGLYTCVAKNRHGQRSADTMMNVMYKPSCEIYESKNEHDQPILVCEVRANPSNSDFYWTRDNETIVDNIEIIGSKSILTLSSRSEDLYGIYYCIANNSVGFSEICPMEIIQNAGAGWFPSVMDENLILIISVVAAAILIFIIIILLMRRRRLSTSQKCVLEPREAPEGQFQPIQHPPLSACKSQTRTDPQPIQNGCPVHKMGSVVSFRRDDPARSRRTIYDSSNPGKLSSGEPLYQNISAGEKKENGPPVTEAENRTTYENMPFGFGGRRDKKGPFKPDINDELLYADMYDDVKLGKVPDPRVRPPLPPKGDTQPKEPPLPPKQRDKGSSSEDNVDHVI